MKKPRQPKTRARVLTDQYRRRLSRKTRKRPKRRIPRGPYASRFEGAPTIARQGRSIALHLPTVLDLIGNFAETAEFVADLRRAARTTQRRVELHFDRVERIRPAALLLLLAELQRCRLMHGHQRVTGTYPNDAKLERMLEATGFFNQIKVRHRNPEPARDYPVDHIKVISDLRVDGREVAGLREQLFGPNVVMPDVARSGLFRALSEAMTNVVQHAYPKSAASEHPVRNRWWLGGHVNRPRGELTITFCDLGVGIPATLPKLYPWEKIRAALSVLPMMTPNDGDMIKAAMTLGRSVTRESHRGKGLNDLRRLIDIAQAGELHIFSDRGAYKYGANGVESVQNYHESIQGTLLKWTVPMDRVTDWKGDQDGDTFDGHPGD